MDQFQSQSNEVLDPHCQAGKAVGRDKGTTFESSKKRLRNPQKFYEHKRKVLASLVLHEF